MTTEPAPQPQFLDAPEPPEDAAARPRPSWPPWWSVLALVAGFAAALFGALVLGVVAVAFGADFGDQPSSVQILATIVQDLCLIGSALLFARMSGPLRPGDFGLRPTRLLPAIGWAVLAWLSFYVFTAAFVALVGASPNEDQLPKELGVDDSTAALVAVAFLVSVVAPIAEEFFFRGFFFAALRNWRGVWPAAIITGLVFGSIHVGSAETALLLPLAFFGFVLCLLRERTGSLYPCIVLHSANNSLAFGVSQHWSWQIPLLFICALALIGGTAALVRAKWAPVPAAAG
jgi:CAAX protease family protein